jgi:hypothetical protein
MLEDQQPDKTLEGLKPKEKLQNQQSTTARHKSQEDQQPDRMLEGLKPEENLQHLQLATAHHKPQEDQHPARMLEGLKPEENLHHQQSATVLHKPLADQQLYKAQPEQKEVSLHRFQNQAHQEAHLLPDQPQHAQAQVTEKGTAADK